MSLAGIVCRNLLRRRARTALTIASISVGVAAVVALSSIARGFENEWAWVYTARGTDLIVTRIGMLSFNPPVFEEDQEAALKTMPDVAAASGVLSDVMSIETLPIVLIFGWEPDTFVWSHLRLLSGQWPSSPHEAVLLLGSVAADELHKEVGSEIRRGTHTFRVCGIFDSDSFTESGSVVMMLPQLQRITDKPGKLNFVNLKLAKSATATNALSARHAITARLPGFKVFTANAIADATPLMQAVQALRWAIAVIALGVGALGIANTTLMAVFERLQELGVLLAVGWRRRRVVAMIVLEAVVLAMAGASVGVAFGVVVVKLLERTPWIEGKIRGDFGLEVIAVAFGLSLAMGVLGGLVPAVHAGRLDPAEALRHE